jgi:hypothetical protein
MLRKEGWGGVVWGGVGNSPKPVKVYNGKYKYSAQFLCF